jgi:ElaB/YqjD/DUF883 family membrane-anchored ribosome-binding protein
MEHPTGGGKTAGRGNGNGGRDLQAAGEESIEELRERFGEITERLSELIRERPATSVLVALGAGFLIGRLLRS